MVERERQGDKVKEINNNGIFSWGKGEGIKELLSLSPSVSSKQSISRNLNQHF